MPSAAYVNTLLFGVYPYVCLVVLLIGSLIRFDREPYTWKSDSSQMLRTGQLRLGLSGMGGEGGCLGRSGSYGR